MINNKFGRVLKDIPGWVILLILFIRVLSSSEEEYLK